MNRTDRLYAIAEVLRATAPRARTARDLAGRCEVRGRASSSAAFICGCRPG